MEAVSSVERKKSVEEVRADQEHQFSLGHKRRPSIGKSMPVTALLLNFPPSQSQTNAFENIARDGVSPDLEKPPVYFHLSDVNESSDDSKEFAHVADSGDSADSGCEDEEAPRTAVADPLKELCNKLCDDSCKASNTLPDVEDLGKECVLAKTPSKIDEERRRFLSKMLKDSEEEAKTATDAPSSQDEEVQMILRNPEGFSIKDMREKFAIAEALAKTSMMTSPAARRRLAARKVEMELDSDYGMGNDDDNEFIPPRQLLLYLVRMGSFNSAPKINNSDCQDDTLEVPEGLTNHDLLNHCKMMRGEDRPQLLSRYFLKPVTDHSIFSNEITQGLRVLALNAVSRVCSAPVTPPNQIRILQWNILSQSLGQNNDNFVRCPEEALTWENRKYLIVEEIIQNNPDVVCLQEVDHFKFLERLLGSQNYGGIFFPKPDSPCLYIQENNGPDGCAIFYKRDKFDMINFDTRILEVWRVQSNQVAIAVNLRVIETGKELTVCTTHLKARNGPLLSKLRNEQGKDLLRFVSGFAQNRPILMCGDFNAEPIEPIYSTILNNKALNLSSAYADICAVEENNLSTSEDACCNKENDSVEQANTAETSARHEPPYTTWKIREEGEVCHTIDYVFYTKKDLKVLNCLMFPKENEIGKNRTPSFQYPSDHFSLVCDFELLDENC